MAEYLKDLNASAAARRAGYSKATADRQGHRLLKNAEIASAIDAGIGKHAKQADLTAEEVMGIIARVSRGDIRKLFDAKGNLRPVHRLEDNEAALLGGLEVIKKNAVAGDGHMDIVHKIKLKDVSRYVEMAGKHFALFTDVVKLDASDALLSRLAEGRKRIAGLKR